MRVARLRTPTRSRGPLAVGALRLFLAFLVLLAAGAAGAGRASADEPFQIPEQVVDTAEVLTEQQESDILTAISRLAADKDLHLSVVFVRDFNGRSPDAWGTETEQLSEMSYRDVLLAVAVNDKTYYLGSAEPIEGMTDAELREVADETVAPAIRDGHWLQAALDTAEDLRSDGSRWWLWVLIAVALVLLIATAVLGLRRRSAQSAVPEAELPAGGSLDALTVDQLEQQPLEVLEPWSTEALIRADNAVSVSGDELAHAVEEFGEARTAAFTAAVTSADGAVASSFRLRRLLDDQPGLPQSERRSLLVQIISMCSDADCALDEQVAEFDQLRDLLADSAERLDALTERAQVLTERFGSADTAESGLRREFGGPAAESVQGNTALARELVEFARDSIAQGKETPDDEAAARRQTVAAIRSAECALDTAARLLDAIGEVGRDLRLTTGESGGPAVATAHVAAAENYLDTRRGAIGCGARTCLTEAERVLDESGSDANAIALATDALALAHQDVAAWRHEQPEAGAAELAGVLVDVVVTPDTPAAAIDAAGGGFSHGGRSPGSFGGSDTSGRIGTGGRR